MLYKRELPAELLLHGGDKVGYEHLQVSLRLGEILILGIQLIVALLDVLIVLYGAYVHVAQGAYRRFQLVYPDVRCGYGYLPPHGLGVLIGELIIRPYPVLHILQLQLRLVQVQLRPMAALPYVVQL